MQPSVSNTRLRKRGRTPIATRMPRYHHTTGFGPDPKRRRLSGSPLVELPEPKVEPGLAIEVDSVATGDRSKVMANAPFVFTSASFHWIAYLWLDQN